jgi:hypothetical protein
VSTRTVTPTNEKTSLALCPTKFNLVLLKQDTCLSRTEIKVKKLLSVQIRLILVEANQQLELSSHGAKVNAEI